MSSPASTLTTSRPGAAARGAGRLGSITALYASAIVLGAFLLFQMEPIMGRLILPSFGGSAAVWTVTPG